MYFFRLFSDAMTECGLLMLCIEQNEGQDNQITFIITSPQHMCLGEWNYWERAPDSAETIYI